MNCVGKYAPVFEKINQSANNASVCERAKGIELKPNLSIRSIASKSFLSLFADLGITLNSSPKANQKVINVQDFGAVSGDSIDDYPAISEAIKKARLLGGEVTILFPAGKGAYLVSDVLRIDFSNVTLKVLSDIKTTMIANPLVFYIGSSDISMTQIYRPLVNVKLLGNGSSIDGNGDKVKISKPFSYFNSTVRIVEVYGLEVRDLKINNGRYHNLAINNCKNILIKNCEFNFSRDFNGLNINGTPSLIPYREDDNKTWTNANVEDCLSLNCDEYGFANYEGVNVVFRNCVVKKDYKTSAGCFSVESTTKTHLRTRTKFIGCKAYGGTKNGFNIQGSDVYMDDSCVVSGVYSLNAATEGSIRSRGGNGVFINGVIRNCTVQGRFHNYTGWGISYVADVSNKAQPSAFIRGLVLKNLELSEGGKGAISLYGIGSSTVIENVKIRDQKGIGVVVYNGSASYNKGNGSLSIKNIAINRTDGLAVHSLGVGKVNVINLICSYNNLKPENSAYAVYFSSDSSRKNSEFKGRNIQVHNFESPFKGGVIVRGYRRLNRIDW